MKTTNWESEQLQSCTTAVFIFQASRHSKDVSYFPLPCLLLTEIHMYLGFYFLSTLLPQKKKRIFRVFSTHYIVVLESAFYSQWEMQTRVLRLLGSENAGFVNVFFMKCIHVLSTYKGFIILCYQWQ